MSIHEEDWKKRPAPIKKKTVMCSTTKCEDDLHSFKTNMRIKANRLMKTYRSEECISCHKKSLVDWKRIDKRNLDDIDYLVASLKKEEVRNRFWSKGIKDKDLQKAKKKGLKQLRKEIRKRIEKTLGPPSDELFQDGRQTPPSGNVIFYAQHATATCCRKCVEEWHNVARDKSLKKQDKDYFFNLILQFIQRKISTLTEDGDLSD